jgi:KDEL-tailed cysteine endopeptidase
MSSQDQGNCGSCWSFSATGALEGAYLINQGKSDNGWTGFSEQQLVSCDQAILGNHGCKGGLMDTAFKWVIKNQGICSEADYPYTSGTTRDNGVCYETCTEVAGSGIKGYVDVQKNSDAALMSALDLQPVSVAIEADQAAFQLYKTGVITANCGTNLDHGVLAVGYGTWTDGTQYYQVKNSWGTSWGMDGYVLIERNSAQSGGMCGILMGPPSYPTYTA